MSRFNNLEFGDRRQESSAGGQSRPKDESTYLAQADVAFRRGRFESALRLFAKVLEFDPRCVAAWSGQVRMLIELGEFSEARLWADKALERFPNDAELLAAKAVAVARLGDTATALALSDASVEVQGDTPYVWIARGDVLMARDERRAESCFDRALALAQGWLEAWLIARVQFHYERFSAALKHAQRAVERDATQAVCWVQIGLCRQALGLVTPARHAFEQAIQLDPESAEAGRGMSAAQSAGWWTRTSGKLRHWFSR
jgi:Flp pilus assembly protein TadD